MTNTRQTALGSDQPLMAGNLNAQVIFGMLAVICVGVFGTSSVQAQETPEPPTEQAENAQTDKEAPAESNDENDAPKTDEEDSQPSEEGEATTDEPDGGASETTDDDQGAEVDEPPETGELGSDDATADEPAADESAADDSTADEAAGDADPENQTQAAAENTQEPIEEGVEPAEDDDQDDPEYRVETRFITAEKLAKIGGAAQRIDEEELKALQYDDPSQISTTVPGVYARGEDGFGLRPNIGIRGANSDRSKKITLMEDGLLFAPAPYSAPAAYYFPVAGRMAGVEIFKGPGSVKFGPNTIGGAMNWITREIPYLTSGGVDLNLGSYLTGKAHAWAGSSNDWGGFLLEGVHWQSDGFKELDGSGDTGFNRQEYMAKGRLNSDFDGHVFHQLNVKLGYSRENSNETYLGLSDADFADSPYRRYVTSEKDQMEWWRTQIELAYTMEVGSDFDLNVVGYRHDMDRSWFKLNSFQEGPSIFDILQDPTSGVNRAYYDVLTGSEDSTSDGETLILGDNQRYYISEGVQAVARHRHEAQSWGNNTELGIRVHYDEVERNHTEDAFLMRDSQLVSDGSEQQTTTLNTGSTNAVAIWLMDQFSFWQLTLAGGLRTEIISATLDDHFDGSSVTNDQFVLIPGLGAHWEFVEHLGLLAGVHRGFSPVSPGQPDEVEPETSVNYELGLRYADTKRQRLIETVGFFNDYNNLLGECTFSAGCDESDLDSQFNGGEVDVYGIETLATWTFPLAGSFKLPVRVAYTFVQSEFKTAFSSQNPQYGEVEVGDSLPYIPEHRGSLRLTVTNDIFRFTANGSYTARMREEASTGGDVLFTDEVFMLDFLTSYEVWKGLEFYGKVENVTANKAIASRRPFGARPIKPFMVQGGVRWNFELHP